MQRSIKEMTVEELEKVELQLWRQREQATVTLQQATNDLNVITAELASRKQASGEGAEEQVEVVE